VKELHSTVAGDRITLTTGGYQVRPIEVRTVAEVKKTFLVDEKGERWAKSGWRYGKEGAGASEWSRARPFEPEDTLDNAESAKRAKQSRLIAAIRGTPWHELEEWELEAVVRIVGA